MKKYEKIYLEYFGYGEQDFVPDEINGTTAADIHHLKGRGDNIENLMALSRDHHIEAHNHNLTVFDLKAIHLEFMKQHEK